MDYANPVLWFRHSQEFVISSRIKISKENIFVTSVCVPTRLGLTRVREKDCYVSHSPSELTRMLKPK